MFSAVRSNLRWPGIVMQSGLAMATIGAILATIEIGFAIAISWQIIFSPILIVALMAALVVVCSVASGFFSRLPLKSMQLFAVISVLAAVALKVQVDLAGYDPAGVPMGSRVGTLSYADHLWLIVVPFELAGALAIGFYRWHVQH